MLSVTDLPCRPAINKLAVGERPVPMLAVGVCLWLRPDAKTSPDKLLCHVYGRNKNQARMIPGWPYSFMAALEPGAPRGPLSSTRPGSASTMTPPCNCAR